MSTPAEKLVELATIESGTPAELLASISTGGIVICDRALLEMEQSVTTPLEMEMEMEMEMDMDMEQSVTTPLEINISSGNNLSMEIEADD